MARSRRHRDDWNNTRCPCASTSRSRSNRPRTRRSASPRNPFAPPRPVSPRRQQRPRGPSAAPQPWARGLWRADALLRIHREARSKCVQCAPLVQSYAPRCRAPPWLAVVARVLRRALSSLAVPRCGLWPRSRLLWLFAPRSSGSISLHSFERPHKGHEENGGDGEYSDGQPTRHFNVRSWRNGVPRQEIRPGLSGSCALLS